MMKNLLCSSVLSVGDYNNDGMDDLYCHGYDGRTSVAISTVRRRSFSLPLVYLLEIFVYSTNLIFLYKIGINVS